MPPVKELTVVKKVLLSCPRVNVVTIAGVVVVGCWRRITCMSIALVIALVVAPVVALVFALVVALNVAPAIALIMVVDVVAIVDVMVVDG